MGDLPPAAPESSPLQPWPRLSSDTLADYSVFRVRRDRRQSPRTGVSHDFYVLDCPNWVNVLALTPAREIVLIEQFRHGTESLEWEIPGGVMDPADASPVAAGVRELREETGFVGRNARLLGQISPNPAILSNTCFTILVEDCARTEALELDHGEDLIPRLERIENLPRLVAEGRFRHSLVVVALYHLDLWLRGLTPPTTARTG